MRSNVSRRKAKQEIDIVRRVQKRLDLAYQHDRDNQIDAGQDLRFLASDQWPAAARQEREAKNRPCLTLNRLNVFVNQVVNDFKQNPPAIKAVPADDEGEKDIADIYNGIMSESEYRSSAPAVIGNAFANACQCGIGHFRLTTEYESDDSLDQVISYKRLFHPLSVFWDPDAREPDRSDANWCIVTEMITEDAFKERYPDASMTGLDVPREEQFGISRLFWRMNDMVRIGEYWEKVPVKRRVALFEGGGTADVTDFTPEQRKFLPKVVRERDVDSWEVRQWLVSGADILDGDKDGNLWAGKYIPIIPVLGHEIPLEDGKIIRRSLIRDAKDAQQLYNVMRTAAIEVIAQQPKAPFLATPKMIAEFKGQWDTHNITARPYLLYKPDPDAPGGRPTREPAPELSPTLVEQSMQAGDEMKALTGIFDAALGNRSNEVSGKGIVARANQSSVGSYHFVDNLNISLQHAGRVFIDLIPKIYDSERVVKLMSEEHEEPQFQKVNQVQMNMDGTPMVVNDLSKGKFQVRIKIGPSYLTRRQEAADSMMKFIQAFPAAAQATGDLIAQNMDWPGADKLAQRLQRMIPPNILGDDAPEPTPQQQQQQQEQAQQQAKVQQFHDAMAQLTLQEKQAGIQKTSAETQRTGAETQLKSADATLRQFEAMITQIHAALARHGIMVNQPDRGYPNPNGINSPSQRPREDPNHIAAMNALDRQGKGFENSISFEKWRRESALADQAAAGTQGRILDNQLKRAKLGQQDRYPL